MRQRRMGTRGTPGAVGFGHWDRGSNSHYTEIVARFGDLPAVLINLAEEHDENYSLPEALMHLRLFADLDPYDHPRGIHDVNAPDASYLGEGVVDFASIQTRHEHTLLHNGYAIAWLETASRLGGRTPMVSFDEPRPLLDRRAWCSDASLVSTSIEYRSDRRLELLGTPAILSRCHLTRSGGRGPGFTSFQICLSEGSAPVL